MYQIMSEAKPASTISYSIGAEERIVLANLYALYHLGIVIPVAEMHGMRAVPEYFWELSLHSKEHSQSIPGCFACRMRERYLAANDALIE